MHPSVARNLLAHIPRLDAVAWIVGQQRFGAAIPNARVSPAMRIGADILRLAIAMDDLKIKGQSDDEALSKLQHDPQFDPKMVATLASIPPEASNLDLRSVPLSKLADGMILQEEIRTNAGVLLAEPGQELTYPLIVRLNNFRYRQDIPEKILVSGPATGTQPQ